MRAYKHYERFFKIPNLINSYWAGFLAADGNIYRNPQRKMSCRLNCTLKDQDHLLKLQDALKASNPIRRYDKNIGDKIYTYYHFNIDSAEQLAHDLETNFNVVERKSLSLEPPLLQEEKYIRAFIRGYFDGDGYIITNKDRVITIGFTGTKSMVDWIRLKIKAHTDSLANGSIRYHRNAYTLRFCGNRSSKIILDWLYCHSDSNTRLDRKYNAFLEYLKKVEVPLNH